MSAVNIVSGYTIENGILNFANVIGAGAGFLNAGKDPGYQAQEYADQQKLSEKVSIINL